MACVALLVVALLTPLDDDNRDCIYEWDWLISFTGLVLRGKIYYVLYYYKYVKDVAQA